MVRTTEAERPAAAATGSELAAFVPSLIVAAILAAICWWGAARFPAGYDHSLDVSFGALSLMGLAGGWVLARTRPSPIAEAVIAVALSGALSLLAALAAAAAAKSGGIWVDNEIAAVDRMLFPFLDWLSLTKWFAAHPSLYWAAQRAYVSIGWQPFVAIAVGCWIIGSRHTATFIAAWGLSLLLCVIPFTWLPARGPYAAFGVTKDLFHSPVVSLPFEYPVVLERIRNGAIDGLGADAVSGLITMPSFHACLAVLLSWAFWPVRWLRWPAIALNMAMILATPVIGGHYFVDVPAGMMVGAVAIIAARGMVSRSINSRRRSAPIAEEPELALA